MEGTLTVPSDEDFDAVEIRCEIQCMEEARRAKDVYDAATNRNIPKEVQSQQHYTPQEWLVAVLCT